MGRHCCPFPQWRSSLLPSPPPLLPPHLSTCPPPRPHICPLPSLGRRPHFLHAVPAGGRDQRLPLPRALCLRSLRHAVPPAAQHSAGEGHGLCRAVGQGGNREARHPAPPAHPSRHTPPGTPFPPATPVPAHTNRGRVLGGGRRRARCAARWRARGSSGSCRRATAPSTVRRSTSW
jgi:hypothetical protein